MKRPTLVFWTLAKVTVAVSVIGWCALHLRRWDSYFYLRLPAWSRVPGVILLITGGVLVLICGGILSSRGILTPEDPLFPKEFVAFGPFRYVRNPMSLGVVLLYFGLGLYGSSLSMLLFATAIFLFLHLVVIYVEEPGLEKRFGESYREYKRSVDRWLPKLSGNKS